MADIQYISIGYECSTASILRGLGLRKAALPFDWIQSSADAMEKCFRDDFKQFHTNLRMNHNKTRLIDEYGFEFPHDYPLIKTATSEGIYEESFIVDDWASHYQVIKEKYDRRIARFKAILSDPRPAIVLCRYAIKDLLFIQKLFIQYYNKDNFYFVNASPEKFENHTIINIDTEKNGIWSELVIWKAGILRMIPNLRVNRHRFSMNWL
jgi:hypothetical protein